MFQIIYIYVSKIFTCHILIEKQISSPFIHKNSSMQRIILNNEKKFQKINILVYIIL